MHSLLLTVVVAVAACSHVGADVPPPWIGRGSHIAGEQRVVGVASASTGRSPTLARSAASNRARSEILRQVAASEDAFVASSSYGINIEKLWEDVHGRVWAMAVLEPQ